MNRNITAIILLVIAIGIYFTVTNSIITDAKAVKAVNDQYVTALDNATKLVSVLNEVTAKYNAISPEDRTRLDKMIPSTVDNIHLIMDLNSRALQHGFTIQDVKASVPTTNTQNGAFAAPKAQSTASVGNLPSNLNLSSPTTSVPDPVLDKVLVSFKVKSGYDQFVSFLQDLESDLRILDLTNLKVTVNDAGTYDFEVQFQTYWLRQ